MGGAGERVGLRKRHREICSDTEKGRLSQPLTLARDCRCDGLLPASCAASVADDHAGHPPAASWKIPYPGFGDRGQTSIGLYSL